MQHLANRTLLDFILFLSLPSDPSTLGISFVLLLQIMAAFSQGSQPSRQTLNIGYITSVNGNLELSEGRSISGAMTLAVENINKDPNILPNYTLQFFYSDTKGDPLHSISVLTDQWKKQAIAFVGPQDFCETEARVAASWNLPMISYVSVL